MKKPMSWHICLKISEEEAQVIIDNAATALDQLNCRRLRKQISRIEAIHMRNVLRMQ